MADIHNVHPHIIIMDAPVGTHPPTTQQLKGFSVWINYGSNALFKGVRGYPGAE
jgi:hypothetical protein